MSLKLSRRTCLVAVQDEFELMTHDKNQAKVTLVAVPDNPGIAARIFTALGGANINVNMIVQNISHGSANPATDLSFTVDKPHLLKAKRIIGSLKQEVGFGKVMIS
jgi:aspartate kinase